MKKILFLLLFPVIGYSQYTSIPDQNFEQKLINLGYDNIIDGQVLTANISGVTSLTLISLITDLTGIEDFIALTYLDCQYNQLTSLDLSQNILLDTLLCYNNQLLASLDLSQNTRFKLSCKCRILFILFKDFDEI